MTQAPALTPVQCAPQTRQPKLPRIMTREFLRPTGGSGTQRVRLFLAGLCDSHAGLNDLEAGSWPTGPWPFTCWPWRFLALQSRGQPSSIRLPQRRPPQPASECG